MTVCRRVSFYEINKINNKEIYAHSYLQHVQKFNVNFNLGLSLRIKIENVFESVNCFCRYLQLVMWLKGTAVIYVEVLLYSCLHLCNILIY